MKGISRSLAYLGAGFFFFLFFLYWTFPSEVLKDRILHQVEDSLGGQYRLKVAKMSAGLVFGFTFKNLVVTKKQDGKDVTVFQSPSVSVNPSYLAMLRKNTDLSFNVATTKGGVKGQFSDSPDQTRVLVDLNDLNLSDLKFLAVSAGVPLKGIIGGEVDLKLSKKDVGKNSGNIDLDLKSLSLDPTKVKLDPSAPEAVMEIPKINLTGPKGSKIVGELSRNNLEIKELGLKGGDLDASLKGRLTLGPKIDDYQLNLEGPVKLGTALTEGVPLLSLFEQQKQSDGSYNLLISGRLVKPSITVGQFKVPF
jgi:type II secretion system protein N